MTIFAQKKGALDRCKLINENSVPAANSSKLDGRCALTLMPTIFSGE